MSDSPYPATVGRKQLLDAFKSIGIDLTDADSVSMTTWRIDIRRHYKDGNGSRVPCDPSNPASGVLCQDFTVMIGEPWSEELSTMP